MRAQSIDSLGSMVGVYETTINAHDAFQNCEIVFSNESGCLLGLNSQTNGVLESLLGEQIRSVSREADFRDIEFLQWNSGFSFFFRDSPAVVAMIWFPGDGFHEIRLVGCLFF